MNKQIQTFIERLCACFCSYTWFVIYEWNELLFLCLLNSSTEVKSEDSYWVVLVIKKKGSICAFSACFLYDFEQVKNPFVIYEAVFLFNAALCSTNTSSPFPHPRLLDLINQIANSKEAHGSPCCVSHPRTKRFSFKGCNKLLYFRYFEIDCTIDNKPSNVTKNMHNELFYWLSSGATCTQCLPSQTLLHMCILYSVHPEPCNGNPRPTSSTLLAFFLSYGAIIVVKRCVRMKNRFVCYKRFAHNVRTFGTNGNYYCP